MLTEQINPGTPECPQPQNTELPKLKRVGNFKWFVHRTKRFGKLHGTEVQAVTPSLVFEWISV